MESDPILREVYRMKDELNREVGGDVGKLFERLRKAEKEHPERVVDIDQVRKISGRKSTRAKSQKDEPSALEISQRGGAKGAKARGEVERNVIDVNRAG